MYQIYQIMPGDDWENIASKFNTTPTNLRSINGIGILMTPGSYLVVPKIDDALYFKYKVKKGDSLYFIANNFQTSVDVLEMLNGLKQNEYIYPEQEILVPNKDVSVYITKEETLKGISDKSGKELSELVMQNQQLYVMPDQLIIYKVTKN